MTIHKVSTNPRRNARSHEVAIKNTSGLAMIRAPEAVGRHTAAHGHFGRKELAWEPLDATNRLLANARNS
jgi:S-adenosylmethionine synthetase